jgi:hypothetical protein
MRSDEIVSYRTALAYLARGDSRAKRVRLAAILMALALSFLLTAAFAVALFA